MAIVRVSFNGGNVPIITGDAPPDDRISITDPMPTGFVTNRAFIVSEGIYCFGLDSANPYTPLWQLIQAVDGEETEISFQQL
jgi:hypothetical protein